MNSTQTKTASPEKPATAALCSIRGCTRPVYQNSAFSASGKCIFHAEQKDAREFRAALAAEILDWRRSRALKWNFSGWVFVDTERAARPGRELFNLFHRGVFPAAAVFDKARFIGDVDFTGAHFAESVSFNNARFDGDTRFQRARFGKDAGFTGAQWEGNAGFDKAHFGGQAKFGGACFGGYARFGGVEFADYAGFGGAEFKGYAGFGAARFCGYAGFDNAQFKADVRFGGAEFRGYVNFGATTFCRDVHMHYASFAVLADFDQTRIAGPVRIFWPGGGVKCDAEGRCIPRGRLVFEALQFQASTPDAPCYLDLRRLPLQEDCLLRIIRTDMSQILLEGTDFRRIEFYDLTWPRRNGRQMTGDEYAARTQAPQSGETVPWHLLAVSYEQLAQLFRRDRNHPVADDFERGVFEARLLAARQYQDWKSVTLLSLAKAVSNFGASIARPLGLALLLLVVCAGAYGIAFDNGIPWSADSLIAALRVLTLDRSWLSHEVRTNLSAHSARLLLYLVALIHVALTAALATLSILALRRRFKHSE